MQTLSDGPRVFWLTTKDAARLGTWAMYHPPPKHMHQRRYQEITLGLIDYLTALEAQQLNDAWGMDVITALFRGLDHP